MAKIVATGIAFAVALNSGVTLNVMDVVKIDGGASTSSKISQIRDAIERGAVVVHFTHATDQELVDNDFNQTFSQYNNSGNNSPPS